MVVRAGAIEDDPVATLVQLSLVRVDAVWLFDVGRDPELSRLLRRRVPAHGLDALMFADADARRVYAAADAVLGRIEGPEAVRALAVGAAFAALPPRRAQARLAHVLETAGLVDVADAAATLAVTLDRVLSAHSLSRARSSEAHQEAAGGAQRVAAAVRQLARGELAEVRATGLPDGLERLSEADRSEPRDEAPEPSAPAGKDDLDTQVDEELAALRRKLGL